MRLDVVLSELGSKDTARMRDAFASLETALRDRALSDDELELVARTLGALARDPRWQIRRQVAHALRFLRSDNLEELLARLEADENAPVAKEAQRSAQYRRERAHVGHLPMAVDERMQRALGDLERTYNAQTRDAAVRVGLAYTAFMVDAMNHQVKAAMSPVGVALEALDTLLEREGGNQHALSWVRAARSHFGQTEAVLRRSLAYVKRTPPVYRTVLLRELVEGAIDAVRGVPPAPKNGLEVQLDVAPDLELDAVPDLLREALVNVMKNAIEASAARRPIPLVVGAKRIKGNVELVVRDQGCGMTQDECDHAIWRPYGSRKSGGTGLGMPIVKKIVEVDHCGKVRATSEDGVGTTISMLLPALQRF